MGTYRISALEDYCHDQAGIVPDDSNRWLFINFLDELTTGHLAYRTLSGEIDTLDDVLDHCFWVLGVLENRAYYASFTCHIDPVPPKTHAWIRKCVREMVGWPSPIEKAGDIIDLLGFKTVGAMSFGRDGDGWNTRVLYWHPFFTADIAIGLLKESVRIDDALSEKT